MSKRNKRVFPTTPSHYEGMSLRQYYIGQALAGIMTQSPYNNCNADQSIQVYTEWVIAVADAVIAKLDAEDE